MEYEQFKKSVYTLTKIDLDAYKERQMKRRIDALITKNKFDGYADYVAELKVNKQRFEEFVNYLTINVSEFYRNPDQWEILRNELLPYLIKEFGKNLTIWSAACSTGDEPYTLVMLLSEFLPLSNIHIIATDIDKQVLEKASVGLYHKKSIENVPKKYVEKYFVKIGDNNYKISDDIKKCVSFRQHNLLLDEYPKNIDLIVCRNVVIYFTDDAKTKIYSKFNESLKNNGLLFVGSTEQIINYRDLNYSSVKSFFYKKNNE